MDRSIPHVRDIFAPYRSSSTPNHRNTEVCVYDYSPGSRRRQHDSCRDDLSSSSSPNDFIDTDHSDSTDTEYHQSHTKTERRAKSPDNRTKHDYGHESRHSSGKRNNTSHHSNNQFKSGFVDNHNHHNNQLQDWDRADRTDRSHRNDGKSERTGDGTGYSSKTLTDRDIRHLERHLSMKKTIRKQISRNLAQAFVEDPKILENDLPPSQLPSPPSLDKNDKNCNNYSFTLTRAKVAKSEPTFLDMLKDPRKEADSGHSSPSHQSSYDEIEPVVAMDVNYDEAMDISYGKFQKHQPNLRDNNTTMVDNSKKSSSFWKKLGFKGKAKR